MREILIMQTEGKTLFPQFAWGAIDTQTYEPGAPYGLGPTPAAAYQDLQDQLEEQAHGG
jgi:hypothetical protein